MNPSLRANAIEFQKATVKLSSGRMLALPTVGKDSDVPRHALSSDTATLSWPISVKAVSLVNGHICKFGYQFSGR